MGVDGAAAETFGANTRRKKYLSTLRKLARRGSRGKNSRIFQQAIKQRKRMIAYNSTHAEDSLPRPKYSEKELLEGMPNDYKKLYAKIKGSAEGRKALAKFKKFWGIPLPTNIKLVDMPGPKGKVKFLVGMGNTGQGGKFTDGARDWKPKGTRYAATDASGKRIYLLSGRNSNASKAELRKVGRVKETHYVPTTAMEEAGTFKRDKYWVHKHDDDGGRYPDVFEDQAGNYHYGPGTYSVTDWIRK